MLLRCNTPLHLFVLNLKEGQFSILDGNNHRQIISFFGTNRQSVLSNMAAKFLESFKPWAGEKLNLDRNQLLNPGIEFAWIFCYNSGQ
jgi:hypothetical protein